MSVSRLAQLIADAYATSADTASSDAPPSSLGLELKTNERHSLFDVYQSTQGGDSSADAVEKIQSLTVFALRAVTDMSLIAKYSNARVVNLVDSLKLFADNWSKMTTAKTKCSADDDDDESDTTREKSNVLQLLYVHRRQTTKLGAAGEFENVPTHFYVGVDDVEDGVAVVGSLSALLLQKDRRTHCGEFLHNIACDVSSGLAELRSCITGFHGDVRTENIFLCQRRNHDEKDRAEWRLLPHPIGLDEDVKHPAPPKFGKGAAGCRTTEDDMWAMGCVLLEVADSWSLPAGAWPSTEPALSPRVRAIEAAARSRKTHRAVQQQLENELKSIEDPAIALLLWRGSPVGRILRSALSYDASKRTPDSDVVETLGQSSVIWRSLYSTFSKFQADNIVLNEQKATLQVAHAALTDSHAAVTKERDELRHRTNELVAELEHVATERSEVRSQLSRVEEQFAQLTESNRDIVMRFGVCDAARINAETRATQAQTQADSLTKMVNLLTAAGEAREAQLQLLTVDKTRLQTSLELESTRLAESQTALREALESQERLEVECNARREQNANDAATVAGHVATIERLSREKTAMEGQLQAQTGACAREQLARAAAERERDAARQEVATLLANKAHNELLISALTTHRAGLSTLTAGMNGGAESSETKNQRRAAADLFQQIGAKALQDGLSYAEASRCFYEAHRVVGVDLSLTPPPPPGPIAKMKFIAKGAEATVYLSSLFGSAAPCAARIPLFLDDPAYAANYPPEWLRDSFLPQLNKVVNTWWELPADCPYLVRLYFVRREDLVMFGVNLEKLPTCFYCELCRYSLDDFLSKTFEGRAPTWQDVQKVLWHVALGLEAMNSRDKVHRDLKSENILLGLDGNWKVSDFGLAKDGLGAKATTQTISGNIFARAPEGTVIDQNGLATYTVKCDSWSLGMLVLEMVKLILIRRDSEGTAGGATGGGVIGSNIGVEIIEAATSKSQNVIDAKLEAAIVALPVDLRAMLELGHPIGQVLRRCLQYDPAARLTTAEAAAMLKM